VWLVAVLYWKQLQVASKSNRCSEEGCQNVCYILVQIQGIKKVHPTSYTNLPTCIDTLWTNMRNLLFWEFQCPMKWNQTSPLKRMFVSSALHPKNIVIHKLQSCFINSVPEFANHICLMLMVMQQLDCISCWWCKQACWLCQLGQKFVCRCLQSSIYFT